jgi:hypothetical protein
VLTNKITTLLTKHKVVLNLIVLENNNIVCTLLINVIYLTKHILYYTNPGNLPVEMPLCFKFNHKPARGRGGLISIFKQGMFKVYRSLLD